MDLYLRHCYQMHCEGAGMCAAPCYSILCHGCDYTVRDRDAKTIKLNNLRY